MIESEDARSERLRVADAAARITAQREFVRPLVLIAGAGTGKTATLVARIVTWSLGLGWEKARAFVGEAPEGENLAPRIAARVLRGVVAITFTEAAAAEMAVRVERALAGVESGQAVIGFDPQELPDVDERAMRAACLRDALDQFPVQTIHAYARRVLAAHPFEAGLHPQLEVDADGTLQRSVVREVVETVLTSAYATEGAVRDLARFGFGPAEIEHELLALLEAGVRAADLADGLVDPTRLRRTIERLQVDLEPLVDRGCRRLLAAKRAKAVRAVAQTLVDAHAHLTDLFAASETSEAKLEACLVELSSFDWSAVERQLKKWQKTAFGKEESSLLEGQEEEIAAWSRALLPRVQHLGALDLDRLRLAGVVLSPLLHSVERALRTRGIATFSSLLEDAASLLTRRPDIATRIRAGIDQLLVDEFQDTDPRQCDIVRALALVGKRKPGLFLVGDPKQSIYGWRSADLAAYEGFVGEVVQAGGEVERLSVNYRSLPSVLSEVERVIEPVMHEEPGFQPAFEPLVPSDANAQRSFPATARMAGVEQWVVSGVDESDASLQPIAATEAAECEARALAEDLVALSESGVAWGEVGVLFRSRGDWDVYLGALREADIPFSVEGDRTYYRRREIIEAAAWVRCILDPTDRIALLTVLRSACVGVPDAAWLPLWSAGFPERVAALEGLDASALAQLVAMIDEVLLPDPIPGLARIRHWRRSLASAVRTIAQLREIFAQQASDVFVETLRRTVLIEATESARFLGVWRVSNLERFFRDLSATLCAGVPVEELLRTMRHAVAEEEPMGEEPRQDASSDEVRILTVHGAKGLDFGHVYLMQLHKGAAVATERGVAAARSEGTLEFRVLGVPTLGFDAVATHRERVAEAERVRLLYVAMTRARDRLVLSGVWPAYQVRGGARRGASIELLASRRGGSDVAQLAKNAVSEGEPYIESNGARFVFPALRRRRSSLAPAALSPRCIEAPSADPETWRARRAASADRMARPLGARAADLADVAVALTRAPAQREPETARLAGVAVHAVLERIDLTLELPDALAAAIAELPRWLRSLAPEAEGAAVLAEAQRILKIFQKGKLGARFDALRRSVLARELPVLLAPRSDEKALGFVAGMLDVVYRDAVDDTIVVVDFKTDDVSGEEIGLRAAAYASQMDAYARSLTESLQLPQPPRCELWFLAVDTRVAPDGAALED